MTEAPAAAAASTYTPHLTFDVVSIRESRQGNMTYIDNVPKNSYYHAERVPALGFILGAYDVHIASLVKNVPEWAIMIKFDMAAKSDSSTDDALAKLSDIDSKAEKRHMLQQLLAERFKLQIRSEVRMSLTYELVATSRAAKLMTPVQGDGALTVSSCNQLFSKTGIEIQSKGCSVSGLLSVMRQQMGTNILDHTGMSGMYAYHLMWNRSTREPQEDEERYLDLVDAIREQLGLQLKETKGPVTFWIVDHIERPTPN